MVSHVKLLRFIFKRYWEGPTSKYLESISFILQQCWFYQLGFESVVGVPGRAPAEGSGREWSSEVSESASLPDVGFSKRGN